MKSLEFREAQKYARNKRLKMYDDCLEKWGLQSQILMLVEESTELAQAGCGLFRKTKEEKAIDHLAEEIADVELMIDEMKHYFRDYQLEGWVDVWKNEKMKRLEARLKE